MNIRPAEGSALDRLAMKLSEARLEQDVVELSEELELNLAAGVATCDLSKVPGAQNWIEKTGNGHLPEPMAEVACALIRDHGFTISHAIATAVSRAKVFATDPKYSAKTHIKFSKAVAEWEQKRAETHGKK